MAAATVIKSQINRLVNSLSILQDEHQVMIKEFKAVIIKLKADFLRFLPVDQAESWTLTFDTLDRELRDSDSIVYEKTTTVMKRLEVQFPTHENHLACTTILAELAFCVNQIRSLRTDYEIQHDCIDSALTTVEEHEVDNRIPVKLGKLLRFTSSCLRHFCDVNILGLIKHTEAIMTHANRASDASPATLMDKN